MNAKAKGRFSFRRKRAVIRPDDRGGFADGGLAILTPDGEPLHVTRSRIAGALRYFVARVELHEGGFPHRLALTAAVAGEGVTTTARSLAAVIAYDTDAKVVVVDFNWRRPPPIEVEAGDGSASLLRPSFTNSSVREAADRTADDGDGAGEDLVDEDAEDADDTDDEDADDTDGADAHDGDDGGEEDHDGEADPVTLADVLERGARLEDAIRATSNPNLSLIYPGAVPLPRRPALASGPKLRAIVEELGEMFDLILFDLPPVLATSDAMNLARHADAYALVVRQGVTTVSVVEAAFEEMQGSECLGVILNGYESSVPKQLRRFVTS